MRISDSIIAMPLGRTAARAALGILACLLLGTAARAHDTVRLPFQASASLSGTVLGNPADPAYLPYLSRCGGAPVQVIQGVGDSLDLGLFTDMQSHCLENPAPDPADASKVVLPFFNGVFSFTNTSGKTIIGQYNGLLRPTATAVLPTATTPPSGAWEIVGRVCISGGTLYHGIVDDCAAGRFFDARGLTILDPLTGNNNAATLFLHQTLGLMFH